MKTSRINFIPVILVTILCSTSISGSTANDQIRNKNYPKASLNKPTLFLINFTSAFMSDSFGVNYSFLQF